MADKLSPPNPPLTDGSIALRPFRMEDAPAITVAGQDPETARWIPVIPVPYTEADAKGFVLLALQAWADGNSYELCIADAGSGAYLGSIGVHPTRDRARFALGYMVSPAVRGKGIATRAVRLAVRWAFENLEIERLALWTLPGNVASQRVAEKTGFRYEGLLRNWLVGRDGAPVDAVMFAMTPDDYAELREAAATEAVDPSSPGPAPADFPEELRATGSRSAAFVDLVAVAELEPGSMRRVIIDDRDLLVAWTPAGIVVTDDRCPHMSAPLSIGRLDDCVVACPLHEGRFDLATGETVQMPTTGGLDADGNYRPAWSPTGAEPKPEPPSKKLEARRLTRVNRLRYYPARIRDGRLEAQVPLGPE